MSRLRSCFALLGLVLAVVAATGETAVGASPQAGIVIPSGQPLQIAVAVDDTGLGAFFGPSAREAVQFAIERHPTVRGFPIKVDAFSAPCDNGSPASLADNTTAANAVVGNTQIVAVLGQTCSPEASAWLPIYEAAGLVTINGSTTGPVAALGPTVFNGTAVPDPGFTPWYAAVKALPGDLRWRSSFQARFGSPPSDFADLYYDAANVLLTAIEETATIDDGSLVIDRAALATAVRHTSGLPGVTCSITLDPASGYRVDDAAALARCASASSEIVFASDRANGNPGEIYALAAGRAPVDVSNSPASDSGAAVRPDGKLVAFWSDRTGKLRLYVIPPGRQPAARAPTACAARARLRRASRVLTRRLAAPRSYKRAVQALRRGPAVTAREAGRRLLRRRIMVSRRVADRGAGRRAPGRLRHRGQAALLRARDPRTVVGAGPVGRGQRSQHHHRRSRRARLAARSPPRGGSRLVAGWQPAVAHAPGSDPARRLGQPADDTRARPRPEGLDPVRRRFHAGWRVRALPAAFGPPGGDSLDGRHGEGAPRLRHLVAQGAVRVHPAPPVHASSAACPASRSRSETASGGTRGPPDSSPLTTTARQR